MKQQRGVIIFLGAEWLVGAVLVGTFAAIDQASSKKADAEMVAVTKAATPAPAPAQPDYVGACINEPSCDRNHYRIGVETP